MGRREELLARRQELLQERRAILMAERDQLLREQQDEADYSAMDSAQPRPPDAPGYVESAARGAAQGASFGFSDELAGGMKAIGVDSLGDAALLAAQGPIGIPSTALRALVTKGPSQMLADYRAGRDESRAANTAAQEANPKTYFAGELAGGLATAAVPGMGVPATIGKALAVGAATGAASSLGSSEADLTKGDVGGAAKDTAIGTVAGGALGGAAHGAVRGVGAVVNRVRGAKSAARTAAREAALGSGEIESASQTGTRKSFFEQSQELAKEWSDMLGEKFRLRPGQATGDPALALAEMKAGNFPATMSRAQTEEAKQLGQSAKLLDMYTDRIAAKPEMLGKADVGKQLGMVIEKHVEKLIKARSKAAAPLYAEAEASGTMVPTEKIVGALEAEIEAHKFSPSSATGQLRMLLGKIQSVGGKVEKAAEEVEPWGDVIKAPPTMAKAAPVSRVRPGQKKAVLDDMLDQSYGSVDSSPSQQADTAYWKWKADPKNNPKPGPFVNGPFDKINDWLELKGGDRVSGLAEAWDLLTHDTARWRDRSKAVEILRREVAGLENLELPESAGAQVIGDKFAAAAREAEDEAVRAGRIGPAMAAEAEGGPPPPMSLGDVQNLRSLLGKVVHNDGSIIDGMDKAAQRRMARNVLDAIDSTLDDAGEGVEALRKANAVWRKHSTAIDNAATDTVQRILKVNRDATDTITSKLLRSSPEEIAGVFRVLNKASPNAAKQVRAQLLDDVLTKAGKPVRTGSIAAEEGIGRMSPLKARNALLASEPQLLAAFAGDAKAQWSYRQSLRLLKRISFGPGIKGSTTAPQLAQVAHEAGKDIADMAASAAGGGVAGAAVKRAGNFILGVLGNDKALNRVYSDPEAIDVFNQALQAQLSGRAPKSITTNAIMALADALGLQIGGREGSTK